MTRLIAILAGGLLLGAGMASVQLLGSSSPAGATGTTTGSTETLTTGVATEPATTAETVTTVEAAATPAPAVTTQATVDIPGPCDEAEHATDPRCTGAALADDDRAERDDRRGRGDDDRGGDDRHGDHHDDDRSGSNSGRG